LVEQRDGGFFCFCLGEMGYLAEWQDDVLFVAVFWWVLLVDGRFFVAEFFLVGWVLFEMAGFLDGVAGFFGWGGGFFGWNDRLWVG